MCSNASDYQNRQRYKHFVKKIQNRKDKNELETAIANYWFDSVREIIFLAYTSNTSKRA